MLNIQNILTKRFLGAAVAAAALITPAIASAQDIPSYASAPAAQNQQIQGTISSINGTWNITVADSSGYNDSVELHQGTIINPTGLTLEPGMNVTIDGYADGSNFDAMEIDTPYQYEGPPPVAVYYGPGSWYPGYAYGWGPSFSLFFDFGSNRFEQRSFAYGGEVRRSMAPPSGWQDRPHGYLGSAGNSNGGYGGQRRTVTAPVQQPRSYAGPPMRDVSAAPRQARTFAAAPQQTRAFAAAPQQTRSFARPPQQTRTYAAPPQARNYAAAPAPQRSYSAPAARTANPAPRGNPDNGGRGH